MKKKAFMSLAAITTLNLFALVPGAIAADADPFAEISAANGKKDYDKVISIAEANLPECKTAKDRQVYNSLCAAASAARFQQSSGKYEDFKQITTNDFVRYKAYGELIWYQRVTLAKLNAGHDFLRRLCQDYSPQAKTNPTIRRNIYSVYRYAIGDLAAAYKHCAEYGDWLNAAHCLSANSGAALTGDDAKALYSCISKILDSPTIVVPVGTARDWAAKTVPGLFTTGKITKKEYITVMKKMYMRFYLRIAEDQKAWEPVIAQIKFGINYADKVADVME